MAISDQELIEALQQEANYRRRSGPNPAKRDTDFIRDAEGAIAELRDNPGGKNARENARKIANRIQQRPFKGRKLD